MVDMSIAGSNNTVVRQAVGDRGTDQRRGARRRGWKLGTVRPARLSGGLRRRHRRNRRRCRPAHLSSPNPRRIHRFRRPGRSRLDGHSRRRAVSKRNVLRQPLRQRPDRACGVPRPSEGSRSRSANLAAQGGGPRNARPRYRIRLGSGGHAAAVREAGARGGPVKPRGSLFLGGPWIEGVFHHRVVVVERTVGVRVDIGVGNRRWSTRPPTRALDEIEQPLADLRVGDTEVIVGRLRGMARVHGLHLRAGPWAGPTCPWRRPSRRRAIRLRHPRKRTTRPPRGPWRSYTGCWSRPGWRRFRTSEICWKVTPIAFLPRFP